MGRAKKMHDKGSGTVKHLQSENKYGFVEKIAEVIYQKN